MKYQFRPYAKMQPTIVTLTGKVYEKGEHPLYKDFRIIEVVDEEGNIHYAFEDELKSYEVKKQETLEEASWKFNPLKKLDGEFLRHAFKEGAKWKQERMYSEEEVYNMIIDLLKRKQIGQIIDYGDIHEWFEQYYKIK